ncbi:MAG: DUF177 domain-containing protein [Bacteroidales bacterium]
MTENKDFIIQIKGLQIGNHYYDFQVDGAFFKSFENSQIHNASLTAHIELEKGSGWMRVNCNIEGSLTVECDRCLEELDLPINFDASVAVKFAKVCGEPQCDDEFIIMDPTEGELNLSQFIYDYVCVNLPLQTMHKEGECNPVMIEKLNKVKYVNDNIIEAAENSPFGALKDLMKKNNNKKI